MSSHSSTVTAIVQLPRQLRQPAKHNTHAAPMQVSAMAAVQPIAPKKGAYTGHRSVLMLGADIVVCLESAFSTACRHVSCRVVEQQAGAWPQAASTV